MYVAWESVLASLRLRVAVRAQVTAFSKRNHAHAERWRLRLPLYDVASAAWGSLYCAAVFALTRLDAHDTVSIVSVLCLGGLFVHATHALYRHVASPWSCLELPSFRSLAGLRTASGSLDQATSRRAS